MNKLFIARKIPGRIILVSAISLLTLTVYAQSITQVVHGKVFDGESQEPLAGASISIIGTNPPAGSISDSSGNFRFNKVFLGRYSFAVSISGYEPVIIPEVLVTSGKEVVLSIGLRQSISMLREVVIKSGTQKGKVQNNMAAVSARSFSVEETRRYAGGLDDPARMAAAFAGVTTGNLQDNAIVIRGNAPKGVSWRLEGVEIPNPNHFAGGNVAGGGIVTVFSSQMLANSDFYTGAFPAEYGNALAGVFDMKFRNGNNEKRESAVQLGLLGIDVSSEGPFIKGKSATYLFNYRYSTLGLLAGLGLFNSPVIPKYQDLSFKLNFPTKNAGTFSVWGIGAIDHLMAKEISDSAKWETDWDRYRDDWNLHSGAAGISHKLPLGRSTYLNTTLMASRVSSVATIQRMNDQLSMEPSALLSDKSGRATASILLHHKFNLALSLRSGINYHRLFYNFDINNTINNEPGTLRNITRAKGESGFQEYYLQLRYDLNEKLSLSPGINAGYFEVGNEFSIDPRLGLKYKLTNTHTLGLGYGRHRQMEDLRIYMLERVYDGKVSYPNKNLKQAKAQHFIVSYDWLVSKNVRIKVEPYYQLLQKVPGIADSSYSMINFLQDWAFSDSLGNNSSGRNIGIDVTLERFLSNNYYFLVTASFFDSKYKAADGIWRDTRFNKQYVINVLAGKEFITRKGNVLGINGRINYVGGERHSPVDIERSVSEEKVYYNENRAFAQQLSPTYYFDITITYRRNRKKYSGVLALQLKNVLGSPSFYGYEYNFRSGKVEIEKEKMMLPVVSYKIEF